MTSDANLTSRIRGCRLCADRFSATATAHEPRPVVWFRPSARLLIIGQAPGARVHASGRPFTDASGDRLRDWLALDKAAFYDRDLVGIVPMAFCFPGYDRRKADLPPPPVCARTWQQQVMDHLPDARLTLLIGSHAQRWHLNATTPATRTVTETVASWKSHAPRVFPLPHPSWRNSGWLKKNPWFASDLLPVLRAQVQKVLND